MPLSINMKGIIYYVKSIVHRLHLGVIFYGLFRLHSFFHLLRCHCVRFRNFDFANLDMSNNETETMADYACPTDENGFSSFTKWVTLTAYVMSLSRRYYSDLLTFVKKWLQYKKKP